MRKLSLLIMIHVLTISLTFSQGFDPKEMAAREKQNLYELLTDLSGDQISLIDGVYEEYAQSFEELRDQIRKSGNFEEFRPKIMALRQEKDEIMADILNEDQFQLYKNQMETNQQNRQRRREQPARPAGGQQAPDNAVPN